MSQSDYVDEIRSELNLYIKCFKPSELYALLFVAQRINEGREKYGVLNPMDGRNWRKEYMEEIADALVYCSAGEMEERALGV